LKGKKVATKKVQGMIPPATQDPLVWAILVVGIALVLVSTVLYRPIERLENRLHLPRFKWEESWRLVGGIAGASAILIALLVFKFG
jgi:hypothetical protein